MNSLNTNACISWWLAILDNYYTDVVLAVIEMCVSL